MLCSQSSRFSILSSLHCLLPFYCQQRLVTTQIIRKLLMLEDKTPSECALVQDILLVVFRRALEWTDEGDTSLYPLFLSLLTAHHEHYYDLLEWSIWSYSYHKRIKDTSVVSMPACDTCGGEDSIAHALCCACGAHLNFHLS